MFDDANEYNGLYTWSRYLTTGCFSWIATNKCSVSHFGYNHLINGKVIFIIIVH